MALMLEVSSDKNQYDKYSGRIEFTADGEQRVVLVIMCDTLKQAIREAIDMVIDMAPNLNQKELDEYYRKLPIPT